MRQFPTSCPTEGRRYPPLSLWVFEWAADLMSSVSCWRPACAA